MGNSIDYFSGMDSGFTKGLAGQGITNDMYGALSGDQKLALSNSFTQNPDAFKVGDSGIGSLGETGIMDSISGLMPTLGGLAQLYMQWDQLQAQKNAARDAHNASATQYNNQQQRARKLGENIFNDYQHTQSNVKKSTV